MREPRKWSQRLQLRAEGERALVPGVVERLDAQVIARKEELAAAAVPQSEREHAGDALEEPRPPRLPAVDQDLAVALRGKEMPRVGELAPQRAEIVDLAVEHDGDRAVGRDERLPAAREIDHRQPAKAEARGSVEVEALVVGTAMRERRGHRGQRVARAGIVAEVAGDAAHGRGRGDARPQPSGRLSEGGARLYVVIRGRSRDRGQTVIARERRESATSGRPLHSIAGVRSSMVSKNANGDRRTETRGIGPDSAPIQSND